MRLNLLELLPRRVLKCWHRVRVVPFQTHATVVLPLRWCSVHLVHLNRAGTMYNWLQSAMVPRSPTLSAFSVVSLATHRPDHGRRTCRCRWNSSTQLRFPSFSCHGALSSTSCILTSFTLDFSRGVPSTGDSSGSVVQRDDFHGSLSVHHYLAHRHHVSSTMVLLHRGS